MKNFGSYLRTLGFSTLIVLSACETLKAPQLACGELDWFEIGRSDGVQGRTSESWQERESRCAGFSDSDHETYLNGWNAGINEYCSEAHGFAVGRSGQIYAQVCPDGQETAFLRGFQAGRKIYRMETDNREISAQLNELSQAMNQSSSKAAKELAERIQDLEAQRQRNRAMINELQDQVESQLQ